MTQPNRPASDGMADARIICAKTGPAPSVPMATATGARLTSAGVKKSQKSGWSTALAGILRSRAAITMRWSSAALPVAAKTRMAPSNCSGAKAAAAIYSMARSRRYCANSASGASAKTTIDASVFSSSRTLAKASSPLPKTATRFCATRKNAGKTASCCGMVRRSFLLQAAANIPYGARQLKEQKFQCLSRHVLFCSALHHFEQISPSPFNRRPWRGHCAAWATSVKCGQRPVGDL